MKKAALFHGSQYAEQRKNLINRYILEHSNEEIRDKFSNNISGIIENYVFDSLNVAIFHDWSWQQTWPYGTWSEEGIEICKLSINQETFTFNMFYHYDEGPGYEIDYQLTGNINVINDDTIQLLFNDEDTKILIKWEVLI